MTHTTEMNNMAEDRNNLCKTLYRIKKETDKRNKEKRKKGADRKNLTYMSIFALPSHIKILFGPFMKTPLYTEIATLEGHTSLPPNHVLCLTLHENKLYSGGCDSTIRIWNTETYEEIATLRGHTNIVRCLTIHENKLYSGSCDKTIRIWAEGTNTETHEEIAILRGHTDVVRCLTIHENKLYSGSYDKTIRIWKV